MRQSKSAINLCDPPAFTAVETMCRQFAARSHGKPTLATAFVVEGVRNKEIRITPVAHLGKERFRVVALFGKCFDIRRRGICAPLSQS